MANIRDFWIQRTLVTKGQAVVDKLSAHAERTAQMSSDEYHHGDELIHVWECKGCPDCKGIGDPGPLD